MEMFALQKPVLRPMRVHRGLMLAGTTLLAACGSGGGATDTASTPASPVSSAPEACTAASTLVLKTTTPLIARVGSVYSSSLYNPVLTSNNGTHNPLPIEIAAEVRKGVAASGCEVRWSTPNSEDHGWVWPITPKTDAQGVTRAWWVAGSASQQQLSAELWFNNQRVHSISIPGTAHAHSTRANSIHINWQSPTWQAFSVEVTPLSWPATTYYSAINFPGGYTGIQSHQLLFSVWDVDGKGAKVIDAGNAICSDFGGEGTGRKCELAFTPKTRHRYRFSVHVSHVDSSSTDYTLWFTDIDGDNIERKYATLRYARFVEPRGAAGFVEDWWEEGRSCLDTAARTALFGNVRYRVSEQTDWLSIREARPSAVYVPTHNEICANYYFGAENGQFKWSTGGKLLASPPLNLPQPVNPGLISLD